MVIQKLLLPTSEQLAELKQWTEITVKSRIGVPDWIRFVDKDAKKKGIERDLDQQIHIALSIVLAGWDIDIKPRHALDQLSFISGRLVMEAKTVMYLIYRDYPNAYLQFETSPTGVKLYAKRDKSDPGDPQVFEYTIEKAKQGGNFIMDPNTKMGQWKEGPWAKRPDLMMKYKVISDAGNEKWPDVLRGAFVAEKLPEADDQELLPAVEKPQLPKTDKIFIQDTPQTLPAPIPEKKRTSRAEALKEEPTPDANRTKIIQYPPTPQIPMIAELKSPEDVPLEDLPEAPVLDLPMEEVVPHLPTVTKLLEEKMDIQKCLFVELNRDEKTFEGGDWFCSYTDPKKAEADLNVKCIWNIITAKYKDMETSVRTQYEKCVLSRVDNEPLALTLCDAIGMAFGTQNREDVHELYMEYIRRMSKIGQFLVDYLKSMPMPQPKDVFITGLKKKITPLGWDLDWILHYLLQRSMITEWNGQYVLMNRTKLEKAVFDKMAQFKKFHIDDVLEPLAHIEGITKTFVHSVLKAYVVEGVLKDLGEDKYTH